MKKIIILPILLLASFSWAQGSAYRYKDPVSGKTVISDQAPPTTVGNVEKEVTLSSDNTEALSYAAKKAAEKYPVIIYTSLDCGNPCDLGLNLLQKRGIPFTEKIVATQQQIDDLVKLVGSKNVPSLTVGGQIFEGFEPGSWNKLLDIAGYPTSAPYGSKPVDRASALPQAKPAPVSKPNNPPAIVNGSSENVEK